MILDGLGTLLVGSDYVTTLILESVLKFFASDGDLDYMSTADLESV